MYKIISTPGSLPERRPAVRARVVLSDIVDDGLSELKCCSCSNATCSFHRNLDSVLGHAHLTQTKRKSHMQQG